jgi:hypothetical protein
MKTKTILCLAFLFLFGACKKEAEVPGSIRIKVQDTNGEGVANAEVLVYRFTGTMLNPEYEVSERQITNTAGECTLCNDPEATTLIANAEGFYENSFNLGSINFPADVPNYEYTLLAHATMEFILPDDLLQPGQYLEIETLPAHVEYEQFATEAFSTSGRAWGVRRPLRIRYLIGEGANVIAEIDSVVHVEPYEHFVYHFSY